MDAYGELYEMAESLDAGFILTDVPPESDQAYGTGISVGSNDDGTVRIYVLDSEGSRMGIDLTIDQIRFLAEHLGTFA